jgi:asparagine synthase (glutamine-hydrolysing)
MCGLVGIFDSRGGGEIDRRLLGRMNDLIRHRGPDGDGIFTAAGIGLGHRRLAIIDLSGGAQPLFNEDRSIVVVFNGEIYNFPELHRELVACGHAFRTHCDTEAIVHAWEEWGEACVERFRGMFAFALWDSRTQTLFLARDRLGKKPLYYSELSDGTVVFGSELKSLLLHPRLPRQIDQTAVEDYFAYGYVPDPKTIYRAVHKLAPGHVLAWRRGERPRGPRAYWDLTFDAQAPRDESAICEELVERLREAVKIRLVSEVPLGAFLSGGVDSSAVVSLMAGLSPEPVNTCSIAFGDPDFDESAYAAEVAARYRTNHHVNRVDPDSFDLVDRLATLYDEPFADSSAMPTYRVCELARKRVTVALSGDGGDEVFAGYRRYRWHMHEETIRGLVPLGLRRPLFGLLGAVYPKLDWAPRWMRAKATLQGMARDTAAGYFHSVSVLNDALRQRLYSPGFRRDLQGYHALEVLARHVRAAPADDPLAQIQYADFKTYLPGDILVKVDRASMAHALEVRVPILDHLFVEWAARVPSSLKLRGAEGKYIFKKSLRSLVPHDILYRSKMGFAVPMAGWFRGPLRDRLRSALTSPALRDSAMFDIRYIDTMIDQHQSGVRDHSSPLWSLLMFESFLRQVHGGQPAATAPRPAPATAGA